MSPDGEAIVTGAGDETLRFWNVFSKMRSTKVRYFLVSWSFPFWNVTGSDTHPPFVSGVCVGAEPVHQDPVISTPLYGEVTEPRREFSLHGMFIAPFLAIPVYRGPPHPHPQQSPKE